MRVPLNCNPWPQVPNPRLSREQEECLRALLEAGHYPFVGPAELIGAVSSFGSVTIVYRGKSVYWELDLLREGKRIRSFFTCNLAATTQTCILWLNGCEAEQAMEQVQPYIVERPGRKPNYKPSNDLVPTPLES